MFSQLYICNDPIINEAVLKFLNGINIKLSEGIMKEQSGKLNDKEED